jgi:hypothetical protein
VTILVMLLAIALLYVSAFGATPDDLRQAVRSGDTARVRALITRAMATSMSPYRPAPSW